MGAGISRAATGSDVAGWTGLLKSGVRRCGDIDADMTERQAERLYGQIADGDVEDLLAVGTQVMRRLSKKPGAYQAWLEDSVGRLRADEQGNRLFEAIDALATAIVTTNYDDLLEEATGRTMVVWNDSKKLQRAASALVRHVFHIHGHYSEPDSIILGYTSDAGATHDVAAQVLFKSLAFANSLLYVGVGSAMDGQNLNALRGWITNHLPDSPFGNFRLVCGDELEVVRRFHAGDRIEPVVYGREHKDLAPFLRALAEGASLEVSQDPASYRSESIRAYPTIGVLDHAIEAQPAVRSALTAVTQLNRLLGQIHNRSREPSGMTDWDQDDKEIVATQMVDAIAMVGEGLRLAADELQAAVVDADPVIGLLLATLFHANDEQLAHTRKLRDQMAELRSLVERASAEHARLAEELSRRKKLTGRWEIAVQLLETAEPGLTNTADIVEGWFSTFDSRRI
ncbi:MAG: SIR2 family protein [Chloroflexi bacterium]|nr:SIR2 family protein [Chloroflexota bacterium]